MCKDSEAREKSVPSKNEKEFLISGCLEQNREGVNHGTGMGQGGKYLSRQVSKSDRVSKSRARPLGQGSLG